MSNDKSCISAAEAAIDFGAGFRQLVWRIPVDLLVRKLSLLIDRPVTSRLEFSLDYDLSSPQSRPILSLLNCALDCSSAMPGPGATVQLNEMEQAMTTALLCSSGHNYRSFLERPGALPLETRVKREKFICSCRVRAIDIHLWVVIS